MQRGLVIFLSMVILSASASAQEHIPLLTGGIGENERADIEAVQNEYNVKLVFTGERGMYLSDVHVIIRDSKDNVLVDDYTEGPFLLVKLPNGRYTFESFIGDLHKKLTVRTGKSLKTIGVNFPVKDEPVNIPMYRNDALDVLSEDAQPPMTEDNAPIRFSEPEAE